MVKKAYKSNAVQKRVNVYGKAGVQLYKDVMYLKSLINSEPKSFIASSSSTIGYAGNMLSLCNIPSGDGESNRDGNRILPRFLNVKFSVQRTVTGTPTYGHSTVRYVIFRWWGESPNAAGVAPTPAEILTNNGTTFAPFGMLNSEITGPRGDRNRRIEVHRTGLITLDSVSKTSFDEDINITLNGGNAPKEHIEFYSSSTAPPTSGGFFVLFVSDNAVAGDCAYTLLSRVTFYDN